MPIWGIALTTACAAWIAFAALGSVMFGRIAQRADREEFIEFSPAGFDAHYDVTPTSHVLGA